MHNYRLDINTKIILLSWSQILLVTELVFIRKMIVLEKTMVSSYLNFKVDRGMCLYQTSGIKLTEKTTTLMTIFGII